MSLFKHFNLAMPIMQAPMAGASNSEFVLSAMKLGILGSLGAGMLSPVAIDKAIIEIKQASNKPFNVNLMILNDKQSGTYDKPMPNWLNEFYQSLGIVPTLDDKPAQDFNSQFEVLLDNPVPVASFTFGILSSEQVASLHAVGSKVVGTANCVDEALLWQNVGADAVVLQGIGAGGHQGGWLGTPEFDTATLFAKAKQQLEIAMIVAGGIGTKAQVHEFLNQGADMVAIGTLFLTTTESVINPIWQQRLLNATGADTRLTRLFSGKLARGVVNDYMSRFVNFDNDDLPAYPSLNAMTKSLRAFGASQNNSELLSLWAGTAVGECRSETMAELLGRLY